MSITEEDVTDVVEVLERAKQKMSRLQGERQQLLEANRRLVELVEAAEAVLEEVDEDEKEELESAFNIRSHEYSFQDGWRPNEVVHEESLDLRPGIDAEEIDEQLDEIRETLRRIRNYKNRAEG